MRILQCSPFPFFVKRVDFKGFERGERRCLVGGIRENGIGGDAGESRFFVANISLSLKLHFGAT